MNDVAPDELTEDEREMLGFGMELWEPSDEERAWLELEAMSDEEFLDSLT